MLGFDSFASVILTVTLKKFSISPSEQICRFNHEMSHFLLNVVIARSKKVNLLTKSGKHAASTWVILSKGTLLWNAAPSSPVGSTGSPIRSSDLSLDFGGWGGSELEPASVTTLTTGVISWQISLIPCVNFSSKIAWGNYKRILIQIRNIVEIDVVKLSTKVRLILEIWFFSVRSWLSELSPWFKPVT